MFLDLIGPAIFLGVIQGLTEFFPVSSSAHLVIFQHFFPQINQQPVIFDVILHLGSLIALIIFFWPQKQTVLRDKKLLIYLLTATLLTVILVLPFKNIVENSFSQPKLASLLLLFTGIILIGASFYQKNSQENPNWHSTLIIGLSQALAVFPGISRSGITISAGIFSGLKSKAAARFSFLLAIPLLLAAVISKLPDIFQSPSGLVLPYVIGFIVSFLVSSMSLKFLTKLLSLNQRKLIFFAIYCEIFGAAVLFLL